ncbi:MAG: hypothetical protein J7M38_04430 [Armatimonadetes bacterium]|nr:hypothetical protein [Armatimonadota bacterium]
MSRLTICLACLSLVQLGAWAERWQPEAGDLDPAQNLALGKTVIYAPAPNYRLTAKGDTDTTDLTDGELSQRDDAHLWFESRCVGWSYGGRDNLALDLGQVQPVREIAIRFQGGSPQEGITHPVWIEALVSDDGENWRRVGEYSTFRDGDDEKFEVPAYEGKAWVHRFRFSDLKVRGRWIGLRMYTTGLSVTDEMYVMKGDFDAESCDMTKFPAVDFSVTGPNMHFHKPYLLFTTNINTPNPIGLTMPPGAEAEQVTVTLDLPRGTELVAARIGGIDLNEAGISGAPVQGGDFTRYQIPCEAKGTTKTWGRIFITGDWPDGREGVLRYRLTRADGTEGVLTEVPLRAVTVPEVEPPGDARPEELVVGLSWYGLDALRTWPDGLKAFKALGLNTVTCFGHWTRSDEQLAFWEQCRDEGFKLLSIDSTFHRVEKNDEIYCQFEDGTHGSRLCPSYRGQYYQQELRRVAEETARVKPDYLFADIELWTWRGPVDAEKCTRCRADFAASGLQTREEWQIAKGLEMWGDAVRAIRAAVAEAGGSEVEFGVYDWRAGKIYQFTWDFDKMYPDLLQSSQVSTYTPLFPYHIAYIGDEVREDRQHLPKSDVLPWITPGDAGVFPGRALHDVLLECFANGARGMNYWSGRIWDTEMLLAYSDVIHTVGQVEDLIINGELLEGAQVQGPGRVRGVVRGDEMMVLVSDYRREGDGKVTVTLPVGHAAIATDLETGDEVGPVRPGEALTVPLQGARCRLLHIR